MTRSGDLFFDLGRVLVTASFNLEDLACDFRAHTAVFVLDVAPAGFHQISQLAAIGAGTSTASDG